MCGNGESLDRLKETEPNQGLKLELAFLEGVNTNSGGVQWQLVRIAITIRMVSAALGCGSISAMTVASTSVITAGQPQEMAFVAPTVTLTTPRKITSATETPTDR